MANKNNSNITIELTTPLVRGEDKLTSITLNKPKAGELRGLQLAQVLQLDVDKMNILIPRISELNERDMHNLEMDDYTALATGVLSFFVSAQSSLSV